MCLQRDAEMEHSQPGVRGEESLRFASPSSAFSMLTCCHHPTPPPHPLQFDLYVVGLKSAFSGLWDRSSMAESLENLGYGWSAWLPGHEAAYLTAGWGAKKHNVSSQGTLEIGVPALP